jgi:hypothetical protein
MARFLDTVVKGLKPRNIYYRFPSRCLKPGPVEYEAEMLSIRLKRLEFYFSNQIPGNVQIICNNNF